MRIGAGSAVSETGLGGPIASQVHELRDGNVVGQDSRGSKTEFESLEGACEYSVHHLWQSSGAEDRK